MQIGETEKKILRYLAINNFGAEEWIRKSIKRKSPIYTEINRLRKKRLIQIMEVVSGRRLYKLTISGMNYTRNKSPKEKPALIDIENYLTKTVDWNNDDIRWDLITDKIVEIGKNNGYRINANKLEYYLFNTVDDWKSSMDFDIVAKNVITKFSS